MKPFTPHRGQGVFERAEAQFGREAWTVEDYLEEGRRYFDRIFTAKREPSPGERELHARAWMLVHCPPSKLNASIDERNKRSAQP